MAYRISLSLRAMPSDPSAVVYAVAHFSPSSTDSASLTQRCTSVFFTYCWVIDDPPCTL